MDGNGPTVQPHPAPPRCAHPPASTSSQVLTSHSTVTPQERKTQEVRMAVSMDTISIVTMQGGGGRGG